MRELNIVEKVMALEAVELFANLSPEQLMRIAAIACDVTRPPGSTILESGVPPDALYVLVEGAVELSRAGEALYTATPNHVLGAWALFDDDPVPLAARTIGYARLLRVEREDFFEVLSDHVEITANIFSTLVKRFKKLMEQP